MTRCALTLVTLLVAAAAVSCSAHGGGFHRQSRSLLGLSAELQTTGSAKSEGESGVAATRQKGEITEGKLVIKSVASSKVIEESVEVVKRVYNDIKLSLPSDPSCEDYIEVATSNVTASAKGIAEVYVSAITLITLEGEGEACAESTAQGQAEARAFAEAFASAVVQEAGGPDKLGPRTTTESIAAGLTGGLAMAFAEVFAKGCTTGGSVQAIQTAFAKAIAQPVVKAYVLAFGGADCGELVKAEADAEGTSSANVERDVAAGAEQQAKAEGNATVDTGATVRVTATEIEGEAELDALRLSNARACGIDFSFCCFDDEAEVCDCSFGFGGECTAVKVGGQNGAAFGWESAEGVCVCT